MRFGRGLAILLLVAVALPFAWRPAQAIPAFARQTGQPCTSCHIGAFGPQLTPFGMAFKITGYTMRGNDKWWGYVPVSGFVLQSFNNTADPVQKVASPNYGTNNNYNLDQAAFFLAGPVAPYAGGMVQITYSGNTSSAYLDDSDLRLTKPFDLGGGELQGGLDLNDGPTVQDPYNTLYHYVYPYASSAVAPGPLTAPIALAALAGNSLGLTNYYWWNQNFYGEFGAYRSLSRTWDNALGETINSSVIGYINGVAPYGRLAYQTQWGNNFLEVGAVGFYAPMSEGDFGAPGMNYYTDYGVDANYQWASGNHNFAMTTNFLQQVMTLNAAYNAGQASQPNNVLNQWRIAGDYYYKNTYGITLSFNDTFGNTDHALYAAAPVLGSAAGNANYKAMTVELDWVPFGKKADTLWDVEKNIKLGVQYTNYFEFNGGTTNYDGFGHNASGNNTLYVYLWTAW
jgi:hypothetical protein